MAPNTLTIDKNGASEMVAELAQLMQVPVDEDCQKCNFNLRAPYGEGTIMAYEANNGLNSIIVQCRLSRKLRIDTRGHNNQPLIFYTVAQGQVDIYCQHGKQSLQDLQAAIHGAYGSGTYSVELPADEDLLILITLVHRHTYFKEVDCNVLKIPTALLDAVKGNIGPGEQFWFDDIYHLPAVDAVLAIIQHSDTGLLHSAHAAGKIHENFFLLLTEYKRIQSSAYGRLVREASKIHLIRNAEGILRSHLQDPPTIPALAKMIGMNQQTLKTGFRQLYGTTINNFVNDCRLEQAGRLITSGGMSIAEVADAVGYSNGGYFSRKFKQKYGVTPSRFT